MLGDASILDIRDAGCIQRLIQWEIALMRTLSIVVALVALVAVGAVGGFDYASNGKIGILPSSWINCCNCCCDEQSDCSLVEPACPSCDGSSVSTAAAYLPCATAEKSKCCEEGQEQDAVQAKDQE